MSGDQDSNDAKVEEIERLEGNVKTISDSLGQIKGQIRKGEKLSLDDLDILVKDINRLDALMRKRRDVGH